MKWEGREESENVEDRRGPGRTVGIAVGGGAGILIIILSLIFGFDPNQLAQFLGQGQPQAVPQGGVDPQEDQLAHFAKVVFHDTEVVWDEQFRRLGRRYDRPFLVLFNGSVESACGQAEAAIGPFYCPLDSRVYLDLSFFQDMQRRLNAPGEFARAYVIAHEVGHHVQRLLGYSKHQGGQPSKAEQHQMSVRLELQADYLAGVWAHHAQERFNFLEPGDVESALNAAFQIGDDRLQKRARGYVVPDSFTHGTSHQRMRWFTRGLKTGDVQRARALFTLDYDKL
jgi:predicted metalloprotease